MSYYKDHATVTTACEVSFQVGKMDYGTIMVPVGTQVFRHVIKSKDAEWKPETVKVSEWFLDHEEIIRLCPESYKINGKPSDFYLHDASHYGITMPNANVRQNGTPKEKHRSFHY